MALMMQGDPACRISLESRVYKAIVEPGDEHPFGIQGTVIGSTMVDGKDAYLVQFDTKPQGVLSFIAGYKIQPLP